MVPKKVKTQENNFFNVIANNEKLKYTKSFSSTKHVIIKMKRYIQKIRNVRKSCAKTFDY